MSDLDHNPINITKDEIGRSGWMSALMAMPREQVISTVDGIVSDLTVRLVKLPVSGLGLLKFNDSALKQSFYLGEFPLATASVELTLVDGVQIQGAAQIMDDDAKFATTLAIADAVLAYEVNGYEQLQELVALGYEHIQREKIVRHAMLTRTKVDFSLLSMADGDNDE